MASEYNSQLLLAEVLMRDGKAGLIKKGITYEDLLAGQVVPKDLR